MHKNENFNRDRNRDKTVLIKRVLKKLNLIHLNANRTTVCPCVNMKISSHLLENNNNSMQIALF